MKALSTIIKPVTTEKTTLLGEKMVYAFWVNKKATKIDIKNSIQEIYGVHVEEVRIINTPAKKRQVRRMVVDKRPAMKKALVTLKDEGKGRKLDITAVGKEKK